MNERIEKLAEQAFSFASDADESDESDANWWNAYNEKFAELIVKECAELVGGYVKENEFGPPSDVKEAYEEITKHFGVEFISKPEPPLGRVLKEWTIPK